MYPTGQKILKKRGQTRFWVRFLGPKQGNNTPLAAMENTCSVESLRKPWRQGLFSRMCVFLWAGTCGAKKLQRSVLRQNNHRLHSLWKEAPCTACWTECCLIHASPLMRSFFFPLYVISLGSQKPVHIWDAVLCMQSQISCPRGTHVSHRRN